MRHGSRRTSNYITNPTGHDKETAASGPWHSSGKWATSGAACVQKQVPLFGRERRVFPQPFAPQYSARMLITTGMPKHGPKTQPLTASRNLPWWGGYVGYSIPHAEDPRTGLSEFNHGVGYFGQ